MKINSFWQLNEILCRITFTDYKPITFLKIKILLQK